MGKNQLRSAESDLLINFKGLPLLPGSRLILAQKRDAFDSILQEKEQEKCNEH